MAYSITYPGIAVGQRVGMTGTVGIGVKPGKFVLSMTDEASPAAIGNLVIGDGERTATFAGCALESARWAGATYQITLLDRRWRWAFGEISGRYNLEEHTWLTATPRELAAMLWAAMGESSLDVTLLPNESRPGVEWDAANPADELEALLASLGCVLGESETGWKVWPLGSGPITTASGYTDNSTFSASRRPAPDQIGVITGPVQYEAVFSLAPVGEDTDGSIKPIDDLSYAPEGGWGEIDRECSDITGTYVKNGETLELRDLAKRCVRRWYRVDAMPAGTGANNLNPPGYAGSSDEGGSGPGNTLPDVTDIRRLLPLVPNVNELETSPGSSLFDKYRPPEVWGEFDKPEEPTITVRTPPGTRINGWSLDSEKGIVRFAAPMTLVSDDLLTIDPANVFLRCVVEVPHPDRAMPVQWINYRDTGLSGGTGVDTRYRRDLQVRYQPSWEADGTVTDPMVDPDSNVADLLAETNFDLDALAVEYAESSAGTLHLDGIWPIALNGQQQSLRYTISPQTTPKTVVGVNSEANPYRPQYQDVLKEKKRQWDRADWRTRLRAKIRERLSWAQ